MATIEGTTPAAYATAVPASQDISITFSHALDPATVNASSVRLESEQTGRIDVSIALLDGDRRLVHVQEYAPPKSIDPEKAQRRLEEALVAVRGVLEIGDDQLCVKVRRQQKGSAQYEKLAASGEFHEVIEGGCRFLVNLRDYLDTGLFLDHRITRGLTTACCETCPTHARVLGDLKDPSDPIHEFLKTHKVQVLKPQMATGSKVYYAGLDGSVR